MGGWEVEIITMIHPMLTETTTLSSEPQPLPQMLFKKWAIYGIFLLSFDLFQTNIDTILQQINGKNVHPVYGAEIQTHDLQNTSLLIAIR